MSEKAVITREKWKMYEEIRKSGEVNMFNMKVILLRSEGILSVNDIIYIHKNYNKLSEFYK
jgi:hypothetical protein